MLLVNLNAAMNLHQLALADALYSILGDQFVFIEFGQNVALQKGSFADASKGADDYKNRPYILRMHESEKNEQLAKELIAKADVMRTGGEPLELTIERIRSGKLTFRSAERTFKGPLWKDILRIGGLYGTYVKPSNPSYRILCQSAYKPNDLKWFGHGYHDKCYKFAYFTQIPELDIDSVISNHRNDKIQIVWCARFIHLKHPELMLKLAKKLITSGRNNFEIQMIGADNMLLWHKTKEDIEKMNLKNHVVLTGGLPNVEVLEHMRRSHIFIFTSNRREGWGAVLNEAMGAGCACVASHEIGSVPFLIKNKENGMIFRSCSVDSLFEKVAYLYDNPDVCSRMGKNAYQTISTEWSARTAAQRLVHLSESILTGNEISFEDGPCSKAFPVTEKELLG